MLGLDNPIHILMVLAVAFMLFGAKRLPEIGKGLGEGLHGFKRAISGEPSTETSHLTEALAAAPAAASADTAHVEPLVVHSASGVEA